MTPEKRALALKAIEAECTRMRAALEAQVADCERKLRAINTILQEPFVS
jgi:hypothetical protein